MVPSKVRLRVGVSDQLWFLTSMQSIDVSARNMKLNTCVSVLGSRSLIAAFETEPSAGIVV